MQLVKAVKPLNIFCAILGYQYIKVKFLNDKRKKVENLAQNLRCFLMLTIRITFAFYVKSNQGIRLTYDNGQIDIWNFVMELVALSQDILVSIGIYFMKVLAIQHLRAVT